MKKTIFNLVLISSLIGLVACQEKTPTQATNNNPEFTILAGSELKDMEPILTKASQDLKINFAIKYTSTIDGVEQVKSGAEFDGAWFSQSKYFFDKAENSKRIKLSEKIMLSPVVVGMRDKKFNELKLNNKTLSWKDISNLVTDKKLTYAMTDPSQSNTGFVALMGIAYSHSGTGESLKLKDINQAVMKQFFMGHKVNSGSSNWLTQAFKESSADFMINYESVILSYNQNNPTDKLNIIYPVEGIVTADYPLLLLSDKRDEYKKLVEYLKSEKVQKEILETTNRRAVNYKVMNEQKIVKDNLLVEMPFNPDSEVAQELLVAYYSDLKKPSYIALVLDTSGSMRDDNREAQLKNAIADLTVNNLSSHKFAKFREREKVVIIPFSEQPYDLKQFIIDNDKQQIKQINDYVQRLSMGGGTAIFSSTIEAVMFLQKQLNVDKNYQYSVILLTDGQNTNGIGIKDFDVSIKNLGLNRGDIKVFPVLFGNASSWELNAVAQSTGGKVFDAQKQKLSAVFKEIRSYQ